MEYSIDGIRIHTNEEISEDLCRAYIAHIKKENNGCEIDDISLQFDGEHVNMGYHLRPSQFEKIRRITGYLVGNMTRWNNAKAEEEHDRTKHA